MRCAEGLVVQAYFDGELDAAEAVDVERHAGNCAACRELLAALAEGRGRLRRALPRSGAPPHLRAAIVAALDREAAGEAAVAATAAAARGPSRRAWRLPSFWLGALAGAAACAAAVVAFLALPLLRGEALPAELVAAHVRSLSPGRLIEVVSTDRHTVKPWFAGRSDVSPVVADFTAQGYALRGGRTEGLAHRRAAVTVYGHGAHVINVFAWPADGDPPPRSTSRSGYHLYFWRVGDVQYCAVSDAGWDELSTLAGLLRGLGGQDAAPPPGGE